MVLEAAVIFLLLWTFRVYFGGIIWTIYAYKTFVLMEDVREKLTTDQEEDMGMLYYIRKFTNPPFTGELTQENLLKAGIVLVEDEDAGVCFIAQNGEQISPVVKIKR